MWLFILNDCYSAREEPTFRVVPRKEESVEPDDYYTSSKPKAPYFTKHPTNAMIKEGHPVRFECTLLPIGDPNMTVEWYCNGELVRVGKFSAYPAYQLLYIYLDE